jgi:hypothetical protein
MEFFFLFYVGACGRAVVEARVRDQMRLMDFLSIYLILPAALGPGVYSASNRNEYQKQESNVSGEQSAAGA